MNRFLIAISVCIALTGCGRVNALFDMLFGHERSEVVLHGGPLELSETPTPFTLTSDAEVVGEQSSVCVVLAGGVTGSESEREVDRLLNGARLAAIVTTDDGIDHELTCLGRSWSLSGKIAPSNEISACVSPGCAQKAMTVGSKVRHITISSSSRIKALGAYWTSTDAFDSGN